MQDVNPQNYRIHLIPDLNKFTFAGKVTLALQAHTAIDVLRLNILELDILECTVEQDGNWVDCKYETDAEKEELHIHLPKKMGSFSRLPFIFRVGFNGYLF